MEGSNRRDIGGGRWVRAVMLGWLGIALATASRAGAITFGADLTAAADNTGTCALLSSSSCIARLDKS